VGAKFYIYCSLQRGQFAPPAAAVDPITVRISNDSLRVLRRFASRESNHRSNEAFHQRRCTGAYTSSGNISGDTFL